MNFRLITLINFIITPFSNQFYHLNFKLHVFAEIEILSFTIYRNIMYSIHSWIYEQTLYL